MAKAREKSRVRLLGVTGRKRSDLLIGTALQATTLLVLAFPAAAQPAPNARPIGGLVVAGSAAISRSPNATTINQASPQAAINWQSFNVGSQQSVNFVQPSANAVALNRVIGPDPSQIAGRIDANGKIVLVNQAGVTFYKGAQVNAQSLIVTSSNISNANFMAGHMVFDQAGNPNARVDNQGTITVRQAGLAALVAPRVANSGVINAQMGHVVLAGVKTSTIDLYGDGLLALDVSNQVTQAPVGPDGKTVAALVTNTGVIKAQGGTVQLTAAAADGVLQNLVEAGGKIAANSVGQHTGTVTIAGIGGSVSVTGLVSASGRTAGTTGGQVAVNATGDVTLGATARVRASGRSGGGTVAIGTTLQRANGGPGTVATMTAANVDVGQGARINASATGTGNGGRVTVLSANNTQMDGSIIAKGSGLTGSGGFVEVSGTNLGLTGMIDVSAPSGLFGTIMLDPTDLDIVASTVLTSSSVDGAFSNGTLAAGAADGNPLPSTVSAATIEELGGVGNVVVQASGSIDVQALISVQLGLTLQAGKNLTIEPGATISAGGLLLVQAGGAIDVRAPLSGSSGLTLQAGGNVTVEAGGALTSQGAILLQAAMSAPDGAIVVNDVMQGASVQLIAGTGGIALNANIQTNNLDLNATGGGVTEAPGAGINAGDMESSLGVTGNVSLLGANNQIETIIDFAVTPSAPGQGNFQMKDVASVTIIGTLSATGGNVYLQSNDPEGVEINFQGSIITGPLGTVSLQVDGFLLEQTSFTSGTIVTGTFELAPNTIGQTVILGPTESSGLTLPSLAGISATQLRIGAVTQPNVATPVITAGTITVGGPFDVLNRNLELDATTSVDGSSAPLLNVATLSGSGGADWFLTPPNADNTITNLGNVTAHDFQMTDSIGLTIAGAVNATEVNIADVGNLVLTGSIITATEIVLSADNIDIPGFLSNGGSNSSLVANVGTIAETGTIIAGGLVGSAVGAVDLSGATPDTNQIAVLGAAGKLIPPGFTGSSFVLLDSVALTVDGAVSATSPTGQVLVASTVPAGINLTGKGSLTANSLTGIVSVKADAFVNNGTVSANTFQLAPNTAGGTVTLGAAGTGLALVSIAGVSANSLVIGAVTQPGGGTPVTSAGGITVGGAFTFKGTGGLTLDAASSTAAGATGAVTQTAPLTVGANLLGTADSFTLTNSGNAIGTLSNMTATTGDLDVVSGTQLFAAGVLATRGNVFLGSTAAGGVALDGPVSAAGRVGIQADSFSLAEGFVTADTFELAPSSSGLAVTLGSVTSGLSLESLFGITAKTARIGAVTPPGGVTPFSTAGAVTIAGPFSAAGVSTLELDAIGAISQSAPLTNVGTLAATGGSVILANTGNLIGAGSGIAATSGNVVLVDGENLTLNGAYSGNDLFFEVATKGGNLTIGGTGPATLTAAAGASLSLVADGLSANTTGSIGNPGGTVQLAPFSPVNVSLAGSGGNGTTFSASLLSDINVGGGTLLIGGFTNLPAGSTALTTTAGAITLDGAVNLGGRAGTLVLLANGSVTEPGGPLTVGTVTGVSTGDFSLSNAANQIQASTGITATNGDIVLVDDPTMTLTGTYTGNNLFFQVTLPGGSLALGDANTPATLVASEGGRVSLVADGITATAASTITVPFGTLEVAPFSAINESVVGTNASGQLLVGATLLADVTGGMLSTLVIGGYTPVQSDGRLSQITSTATPSASAGSVTLDGALNLTALAVNLELLSTGPVSEPGGPLTVANVFGASGGTFSLANPANAIGHSLGIASSGGDVVLVDGIDLELVGAHTGNNLFFEVAAKGGTLILGTAIESFTNPAQLTAASGGRISLVADNLSATADSTVTAPAGTLELAPFSPVNVSVFGPPGAGPFLVDPTMLSIVTPGLATLVVGGFTNEPAGATTATPSASSLSVDGTVTLAPFANGIDLQATGAVTQVAPLVNVGTLGATGASVVLANAGNQIATSSGIAATAGNIVLVDGESLALNGAYSGNNLFFEVAAKGGALTIGGTIPATLSAANGARISLVADGLSANTTGSIGNAGGTVELAPFSAIDVSLAGTGNSGMVISSSLLSDINVGGGTLLVGGFTNLPAGGSAVITTAGSITLDGAVDLSGRAGTLVLLANGSVTEPGGPLTVGTVTGVALGGASVGATGVAGGDFSLSNTGNQIQASTGITASHGSVILVDDPTLQLTGTYSGTNLFFQVTQPGGSLALGDAAAPAILTAAGKISLVADSMTATATSTITNPFGTLELAPFSAINESVAGSNGSGQLLVDATLLGDISGGTNALNLLVIGGFTPLINGTVRTVASSVPPTVTASGVTIDGPLNLATLTTNLELLANGPVTEPGGPLTVNSVFGSSVGTFSLTNPANAIARTTGIAAAGGDLAVVDSVNLAVIGSHSGANLFFEVASPGGTLTLGGTLGVAAAGAGPVNSPATLTAASGDRLTLVADHMTENGSGSLTAPGGTVELAPFSAINTSVLGNAASARLLIDPTLLSSITPGIATLRIGGFTNEPAGATSAAPAAASISIDGTVNLASVANTLDLQAIGAVTQAAPILNVGTLTGTTGATTLSNSGNSVGVVGNYLASNGFALTDATSLQIAGTVAAGPSANFNVGGTLTETGGITANRLSGSALGTATLTGNNSVAELDGFVVGGASSTLTFAPNGNLLIDGTVSATRIVVSAPSSQLTLGDGASIVTGGSIRPTTTIAPASLLPANGGPGAYFQAAGFNQTGASSVSGLAGGPSTLQISVSGNVQFDTHSGLSANGTWLILTLTTGTATGDVAVKALDVSFTPLAGSTTGGTVTSLGGADLFGTVNGVAGTSAAGLAFIQPALNKQYLFNNCEIGSAACLVNNTIPLLVRIQSETAFFVPAASLLTLMTPALVLDPEDSDNLLEMPVVSKEDY